MIDKVRVLMLGDLIGNTGKMMLQKHLKSLKERYKVDAVIVNGENSNNNGRGITTRTVRALKHVGVNVITTGNHVWDQKDILDYFKEHKEPIDLLRPANFPSECPGKGVTTFLCNGFEIAVVNLQGRVFMKESLDCPFKTMDSILTYLQYKTNIILVDFHAETSSEKLALGYYLDGKVSCVVGTHTHVPTADERILPKGTGYVTDLGMAGSLHSLIGFKKDALIARFKNQMPCKFEVETEPPVVMTGIFVEIDTKTGKALHIERVKVIDEQLIVTEE